MLLSEACMFIKEYDYKMIHIMLTVKVSMSIYVRYVYFQ